MTMGHQINFYFTPSDMEALRERLRDIESFLVLHSRSANGTPNVLASFDASENGKPWLFLFLVRPNDLDAVVMRHVPAQGYWSVDVAESPVVEVTKCFFDEKILRRGRAYYMDVYYAKDGALRQKGSEFRAWAKKVLSAVRRGAKKMGDEYIGQDAYSSVEAGQRTLVQ